MHELGCLLCKYSMGFGTEMAAILPEEIGPDPCAGLCKGTAIFLGYGFIYSGKLGLLFK